MVGSNCFFMNLYNEYVTNRSDSRIQDLPLMSSPLPTIGLVALYLLLVKRCLPKFMEKRSSYKLNEKSSIQVIWLGRCIVSTFIFFFASINGWITDFSFLPRLVDSDISQKQSLFIAHVTWSLFAVKFLDLIDTIILVLNKDHKEITTYHVFQRTMDPIVAWFIVKLVPESHYAFGAYLHVINTALSQIMHGEHVLVIQKILQLINILQVIVVFISFSEYYANFSATLFLIYNLISFILFSKDSCTDGAECPYKIPKLNMEFFENIKRTFGKFGNICIMNQEELYDDEHTD